MQATATVYYVVSTPADARYPGEIICNPMDGWPSKWAALASFANRMAHMDKPHESLGVRVLDEQEHSQLAAHNH